MIEPPEFDLSKIDRFTEEPYRKVQQLWGVPLLIGLNNRLHFERLGADRVRLTIEDPEKNTSHEITMHYTAEQLCATHNEIDLVFRLKEGGILAFDQDHEDNSAPSNGGSTGTGERV
jgi:hypothetical protein